MKPSPGENLVCAETDGIPVDAAAPGRAARPASGWRADRNYRWFILALLFAVSFFNYFDRQTVSVLKTTLKDVFAMNDADYAVVVNVFTGAYAFAYIVSGWIVDRLGPRRSLSIFVSMWSAVTVACGFAQSFWQLAGLRGLLGLAEPGLFPVTIRTATVWMADKGRGLFMALGTLGSSVATIVAVPIIAWLTVHFHWRLAFILPGVLGLGMAAVWWAAYREPSVPITDHHDHGHGAGENPTQRPAWPWRALWHQRALWAILLGRLVSDPVWYFCVFWMPGYLQEAKGLSIAQLGFVGWIPFLAGNVGGLGFTALSDYCARRYGLMGRKRLVIATAVLGPLCMLIPTSPIVTTLVLFCVIAVVCNCWLGSVAPIIAEAFPVGNVASVYGIAGAFGAGGAMIFNYIIGHAAQILSPGTLFIIMGCLHPCAAVIFHFLLPRKSHAGAATA